jgi:hypothetical protein
MPIWSGLVVEGSEKCGIAGQTAGIEPKRWSW